MRVLSFGVALSGAVVWATFLGACGSDDGISTFHAPSPWKLDAGGVALGEQEARLVVVAHAQPCAFAVTETDEREWLPVLDC